MGKLLEKDIENRFIEIAGEEFGIEIIGQQVKLDTGIADVIGWQRRGPVVIEIKRGKAPPRTLGQLLAYMEAVSSRALGRVWALKDCPQDNTPLLPHGYIVATSIDEMSARAIKSSYRLHFIKYEEIDSELAFTEYRWPKHWKGYSLEGSGALQDLLDRIEQEYLSLMSKSHHPQLYNLHKSDERVAGFELWDSREIHRFNAEAYQQ